MDKRKKLYQLLPEEREIFKLSLKEPNIFTDFYLRSEFSGTWYLPGAETTRWREAYSRLHEAWKAAGKPEALDIQGLKYEARWDHEKSEEYPKHPAFFRNHGTLMLPYVRDLYFRRQTIQTIIGGFGSGKSMGLVQIELIRAATLSGYKSLMLAPSSEQAKELQSIALQMIAGTLYEERFLIRDRESPHPLLVIGNSESGRNTIDFFPMDDNTRTNSKKFLSLTRDCAIIDQAEKFTDLRNIVENLGSRMRGRVPRTGRGRIGTITFLANSSENQQLWDYFDMSEVDPKNYFSLQPSSYDNIFLTDADMARFELTSGYNEEARQRNLFGKRPLGDGKEFPRNLLEAMRSPQLDEIMREGIARDQQLADEDPSHIFRYIYKEGRGVGVYEWFLPPQPGHKYVVISDPGTKDPPNRDSAVVMVWDITDFPGTRDNPKPATLVGFAWIYGNGSINVWATRYMEITRTYGAVLQNAFDATAYQSGYEQWIPILGDLYPEKINLAGNGKFLCLNAAKILTSREMIRTPAAISHLYSQLARYEYPEPKDMRQDIVMSFIMSCWWLQRLFLFVEGEFEARPNYDPEDRHGRTISDRNAYHSRDGSQAALARSPLGLANGRADLSSTRMDGRESDSWYERVSRAASDGDFTSSD